MKKFIVTVFAILGFVLSTQAQSEKVKTKINKKIEKINQSIVASNDKAALTPEQKEKIFVLLLDLQKTVKKIKKENAGADNLKELMKAESKKVNKKINKEILTKEQRQAKKMTRQRKKNKK